jgi:hypothetical protein
MAPQAFDWNQYLTLAQELGRRGEEAALRSSISGRTTAFTIWCVYNLALRRAEQNGFVP